MALSHVPRLKDVAKAANVSLAAASRILRGDRDRFGEETCRRVLEASRQLGWRRNLLVNGMQTGRTQTIGVMIPPVDSFWMRLPNATTCPSPFGSATLATCPTSKKRKGTG
jgi:DNA-binding LacI/PurR family transcriptional regulator